MLILATIQSDADYWPITTLYRGKAELRAELELASSEGCEIESCAELPIQAHGKTYAERKRSFAELMEKVFRADWSNLSNDDIVDMLLALNRGACKYHLTDRYFELSR